MKNIANTLPKAVIYNV